MYNWFGVTSIHET